MPRVSTVSGSRITETAGHPDKPPHPSVAPRVLGVDFTSAPCRRKPITVATCLVEGGELQLLKLEGLETLSAFDDLLRRPGPWVGGFDCPFGLPAEFIAEQGWEGDWSAVTRAVAQLSRDELKARCRQYCDARPAGHKFAHRATDGPAGSSPSMKWVNPPVVLMLHAAAPRLLASGVHLPAHRVAGDATRVALETYPGYLARRVTRASYKSDTPALQTAARRAERERIVAAVTGRASPAGLRARVPRALKALLIEDASGDSLDALLCALQAASARNFPDFGVPLGVDPREGWIAGVLPIVNKDSA